MHVLRRSVAIGVSTFFSGIAVSAAPLLSSVGPAEIPPANYASKQYVDSKGCVFVKAGVGSTVSWVPRVTQSRELVCGYKPSLQTGGAQDAAKAAPAVSKTTAPPQTAQAVKPVPSPAPEPAVFTTPQKTRVAPVKTQRVVSAPQTSAVAAPLAPPVPRLPAGYKPVWDDDRLNPKRGYKTARGEATMRMIWTDTVPRRLVPENGQDVKLIAAQLRYREANGAAPSSRTATGTKTAPKAVGAAKGSSQTVTANSESRLVHVGAFGSAEDARATARKFSKMGLPAVIYSTKHKGRSMKVLYLGPFARNSEIKAGLKAARSAGFQDVFVK